MIEPVGEFAHVFGSEAMRCTSDNRETLLATVWPSENHEGYWHAERITRGDAVAEGFRRPAKPEFVAHVLRSVWRLPSDPRAWSRTAAVAGDTESGAAQPKKCAPVVYFLNAGPFVKIGFSSSGVEKRVDELKTGCPFPIVIAGVIDGAQKLERELHKRFAHLRVNLEWFQGSPELLRFIRENTRTA